MVAKGIRTDAPVDSLTDFDCGSEGLCTGRCCDGYASLQDTVPDTGRTRRGMRRANGNDPVKEIWSWKVVFAYVRAVSSEQSGRSTLWTDALAQAHRGYDADLGV
jgi:hypothetical protein